MVRADFLIFGYRKLYVEQENKSAISSIFLQNGIPSTVLLDGSFLIKEKDKSKIGEILSGRTDFSFSKPKGIYGLWTRNKAKAQTLIFVLIFVISLFFSQSVVWDVRPIGNEQIANSELIHRLDSCGFSVGAFWNNIELVKVENDFLRKYDDVAWININRRGMVAYVSLMEKKLEASDSEEKIIYSNIVASRDCVIEEITVKSGTAVVKAGDSVKAGDLLILGTNSGVGEDFCRAEGNIVGRVSDTVIVNVDREYQKNRIASRKIQSIKINIFKKSINIFKTYGNLTNDCAIIEDVKEYALPNGVTLPFTITLTYLPTYDVESLVYDDKELILIAGDRVNYEISLMLSNSDLVSISSDGDYTDAGYTMRSNVVYFTEVGREKAFEITD